MPTLKEILQSQDLTPSQKIAYLTSKTLAIPTWDNGKTGLRYEYEPAKHPVMDKSLYPDIVNENGRQRVTRVTFGLQKLAVSRMVGLINGTPATRIYTPENDRQKQISEYMEKIYTKCCIDEVNDERLRMLYASCEIMTLWYAVEQPNNLYGFNSKYKLRCRNFSPMQGDMLYPLFDEYGDMVALSVQYTRKVADKTISYFDAYTADQHIRYSTENGTWNEDVTEAIQLMKIPAVYIYRPTPIWEDQSSKVEEMEWAASRNGNYLRENSRPIFCVFADEEVPVGDAPTAAEETVLDLNALPEENKKGGGFKDVLQLPSGSDAKFVTWQQAGDNLNAHLNRLKSSFFTELQLPDWNYENMSQIALSGESRKQLFIDAMLKVKQERGRLVKAYQRECNVIKEFMKAMLPAGYAADIDALPVEHDVKPFTINDEKDTITNLMAANGNKPLMSQRESIEMLGWSGNVDKTLEEINKQAMADIMNMAE